MTKRLFLYLFIAVITVSISMQQPVLAQLKQDFIKFVDVVKKQVVNNVSKKVSLNFLSPVDTEAKDFIRHCQGMSTSNTTKQTPKGTLSCLPKYKYQLQDSKYRYIYDYRHTDPQSKLKLVTSISSSKYPIGYYSYAYPTGDLKAIVIELSAEKKMLFDPDGNLVAYTSPKMCVKDVKGELSQLRYTYEACNTLFNGLESRMTYVK